MCNIIFNKYSLIYFLNLVCKDRDDTVNNIDKQCNELYTLKLKVLNLINRKVDSEECPYHLNIEISELFGNERLFIQIILEEIWKKPEIMYLIITKCVPEDINYNLSSFIINNFYNNILSSSYMENNLLYLLSLLLKDEVDQLNSPDDVNFFLNETKCGILLDQMFKQNDIQIYFKSIFLKTIETLELLNSNRKIEFSIKKKEEELTKYENILKKNKLKKKKKTNKDDEYKELINVILFENFSCNRMDLMDNLIKNKIDQDLFISKYIPDLNQNEIEERIKNIKDKNDKLLPFYESKLQEIKEANDPDLFSNKNFFLNVQAAKVSVFVLNFYRTDFNLIIAYMEQILENLKENIHLLPYSVKCLCKIISILIKNKFPNINEIQKNAFVSCFLFEKILAKILNNPAVNALIGEFIVSGNTLHNLSIINNILKYLTNGLLFKNGTSETDYTPFNWFILDKIPELLTFYGHINKVPLPDFINKFVNGRLDKNYNYEYFKENPEEIVTHISICFNIDNLISILKCINKNKEEVQKLDLINSPKGPLMKSFNRLYNEEYLEKIMKFAQQRPDKNNSDYDNIAITQTAPIINFFLYTKKIINEKYKILFNLDSTLHKNFYIKEIETPKTKDDVEKNILIKVKNYISNSLFNYKLLEKNDFEEGTINDTKSIFEQLKRFMKSSNFIMDASIPSMWYINSLLNHLNKLPEKYKINDFNKLFEELKSDIEQNINLIDFQSLILFHNKLKFLSLSTKQYKISKELVQKIDTNQIVKKHIEEEAIPVEVDFQYDESKLKIEKSKMKLDPGVEFIEDPKKGLIVKTIATFIKKFPNLVRHQYLKNSGDIFEMLKDLKLPEKLNDYFKIIKSHFDKKKKKTNDAKYNYEKFQDELKDYVMKKLYEKIYPQDPCENDNLALQKCVMLSWTEPSHFINKKTNYVYDSFLPDVIALFRQIHKEKTPEKKMERVNNIFILINNVIKFNDQEGECGADDTISILTYSLAQSCPYCIYSDLKFLKLFYEKKMKSFEGNQLSQLSLACDTIININAKFFKMDEEEFKSKCDEARNNPNNNLNFEY